MPAAQSHQSGIASREINGPASGASMPASHMSGAGDSRATLREILTPVFYYKYIALAALIIPVVLALIAALTAPTLNTSNSKLLILLSNDYTFQGVTSGGGMSFDRNQIIQAEMEILASRDLQAEVIRTVGLKRAYPGLAGDPKGMEKAVERFGKDMTILNIPQSNIIALSVTNPDAKVAIDLINTLDDVYIDRRRDIFQQVSQDKLNTQRAELTRRLGEIDAQMSSFAQAHNFGNYDQALAAAQTEQSTLISRLQSLDEQLASTAARLTHYDGKLRQIPEQMELYNDQARSAQLDDLTARLLSLENQRREAAAKYTDTYPLVVDLDRRIAEVRRQLEAAPRQQTATARIGINPTYQTVDQALTSSQGDVAALRQARAQSARDLLTANERLNELTRIGPALRDLTRGREVLESTYSELAKRAEEAQLSESLAGSRANVRIIQRGEAPTKRKTLRMPLMIAGLGLGLFAAAASVVLASAFSQTMITPRNAEQKLNLPVALSVPFTASTGPEGARTLASSLLSFDESLLLLRLAATNAGGRTPVIQLISSEGGAGVSSIALDFGAMASTASSGKVLVMDIEPQKGAGLLARLKKLGAKLTPFAGQRVMNIAESNLYVSCPVGSQDLIVDDEQWQSVLNRARQSYNVVIIDSPAATRSSAGVVIAPSADLTILVVEAEHTRAAVARKLIDRVEAAGGQVSAVIFNKRRYHIPRALYSVA
jgi:polysaccharide biosynthesis transport protein